MKKKGSATVEALLVIPSVFVFVISMIWLIEIFRVHAQLGAIISEAGSKIVAYSYPYSILKEKVVSEDEEKEIFNLIENIGLSNLAFLQLENTINEYDKVSLLACEVDNNTDDAISIRICYKIFSPVKFPGFDGIILTNSFYSKKYVGQTAKREETEYVYITKDSAVYHTKKECTGIKTTVSTVFAADINDKRNKSGSKYYPCSKCSDTVSNGLVFITPYGTRYHNDSGCKDLKSTVYRISIEEIGDRRKCYFCE